MSSPTILNISTYKFVELTQEQITEWRPVWKAECIARELRGTILLSPEGINVFLAGTPDQVNSFWAYLTAIEQFADMEYKPSYSHTVPFKRMKVKLKKEIIPMGHNINPTLFTAPRVKPQELKQWLDNNNDVVMLDTRNLYEVEFGTFDKALTFDIKHFRTFPEYVAKLDPALKNKTIVTFCTGGIRCEKAGAYMIEQGFNNVYQLDGGILKYFEDTNGAHYNGGCFVFDDRVSLDPALQPDVDEVSI